MAATTSLAQMRSNQGGSITSPEEAQKRQLALQVQPKLQMLESRKNMLGSGASESIKVDREIRAAALMLMNSRELRESTTDSFYTAVSNAINSGIGLCNGRGYLIPYRRGETTIASFVPGWKGLVDLVARTGRATVWTGVVYNGDFFDYQLGDDPFVRHKPEGDSDDWQQATHVYAIGRIKGQDYPIVVVWTIKKVIKHLNKYNKVGSKHYALKDDNNMEMYARKVVLLQAIKYLPSSQDLDNALAAEHAAENQREVVLNGDFVYVPDENGNQTGSQQEAAGYQPAEDARDERPSGPPPGPDDADQQQRQPQQSGAQPGNRLYTTIKTRLEAGKDVDTVDADADLINKLTDEAQKEELTALYRRIRAELTDQPAATQAQPRQRRQMTLD